MKKRQTLENDIVWLEYGVDLKNRQIMIDEDIDEYSVGWAIRGIKLMERVSDDPIDIYVSSYGGNVHDGLALYDVLTHGKCIIKTHALGKIMSMGLMIFLAGDERYALPSSSFMNHGISSATWGKLYEMKIDIKEAERLEELCLKILDDRTLKSYAYWKDRCKYEDEYLDKTKAIELGIVTNEYE